MVYDKSTRDDALQSTIINQRSSIQSCFHHGQHFLIVVVEDRGRPRGAGHSARSASFAEGFLDIGCTPVVFMLHKVYGVVGADLDAFAATPAHDLGYVRDRSIDSELFL